MRRKHNHKGFTMAEMLIVVAIIAVLGAVSFIAVQNYQRDLALLERDSIAKEIFIAAQNHLTMANTQGYMGLKLEEPTKATSVLRTSGEKGKTIYDAIYNGSTTAPALDVLLPFGSIDETVRAGGRYVIRYQLNPALVLDVFYWTPDNTNYGGTLSYDQTVLNEMGSDAGRGKRKGNSPIVGWFGGEIPLGTGDYDIQPPEIKVNNAEKLTVEVKDANGGAYALKLIITGVTSEAKTSFDLSKTITSGSRISADITNNTYTITLDDITTSSLQFANLTSSISGKNFIPGEDIVVQAVAFNNSTYSNIAYSGEETVNSLFAGIVKGTPVAPATDFNIAQIANFRHLENLDNNISNVKLTNLTITTAQQTSDLIWADNSNGFVDILEDGVSSIQIFGYNTPTALTGDDCYYPISPDAALTYTGLYTDGSTQKSHTITGVIVNHAHAGLFGNCARVLDVSYLDLIDFDITGTASAGALAGTLANATVSNVLAYYEKTTSGTATIKATGSETDMGNAGGLIGVLSGGSVSHSAAALNVSAEATTGTTSKKGGNAGGLIGSLSGSTTAVSDCYVGGHLYESCERLVKSDDTYPVNKGIKVTAAESAGGLIGYMEESTVSKSAAAVYVDTAKNSGGLIGLAESGKVTASYSAGHTENAEYFALDDTGNRAAIYNIKGTTTAGGLIGNAVATVISDSYSTCSARSATAGGLVGTASGKITNCYCTGLVGGTTVGAFVGSYSGTASNCQYFEIVNEIENAGSGGFTYMKPVANADYSTAITALDASADSYNTFVGAPAAKAYVYDETLTTYYGDKFWLKSIPDLVKSTGTTIDSTDFVYSHYGDWPAPEIFVFNTAS